MNIILLSLYISCFLITLGGFYVLLAKLKSLKNISFFLITLIFSIVTIVDYNSFHASTAYFTLIFIRLTAAFGFLFMVSVYLFSESFAHSIYLGKKMYWLFMVSITVFVFCIILSPLTFISVTLQPSIVPKIGFGIAIFLIASLCLIFLALKNFIVCYFHSKGYEKAQLLYIFTGFLLLFVFIFIFSIILPIFVSFTKAAQLMNDFYVPVLFLFLSYSILKQRLFNLRIAVRRISIFLFSLMVILILEILVTFFIPIEIDRLDYPLVITFTTIALILFPIIYKYSALLLDGIVFKKIDDVNHELDSLLSNIIGYIDINDFYKVFSVSCQKIFGIGHIAFLLYENNELVNILNTNINEDVIKKYSSRFLNVNDMVIVSELVNLSNEDFYKDLVEQNIEIIKQVSNTANSTRAIILLGSKKSRDPYYIDDFKILEKIQFQVSVFLSNLYVYTRTRNFNKVLESKIKEATQDLSLQKDKVQEAYNKLKEATQKEHDMIDIMGHELRTPATIIKLAVYLLEQSSSDENSKKYISEIKDNVENEIELINTLLDASKLDNSKIEIEPTYEDIVQIVREVIEEEIVNANEKKLALKLDTPKETIPKTMLDKHRIREAITNYITNAIKYTPSGIILVNISLSGNRSEIILSVKDTGVGFSDEDKKHLFQKFHRLNNYISKSGDKKVIRPGGTGLGLYVVKGMIELHNGKVWAESDGPGKGSTFYFSIPLKENSYLNNNDSIEEKDMFDKMRLRK